MSLRKCRIRTLQLSCNRKTIVTLSTKLKHISVHLSLIHKIQNQSGYIDKLNPVVHLRTRDHRQQSQFCVRWNCREKSQGFRWFCSHVNHVFQPNNCTFVVELATILSHHAKRDWLIRFPWIVEFFLFVSQTSRTLCKEQKGSPHLLDVQWLCRCGAFLRRWSATAKMFSRFGIVTMQNHCIIFSCLLSENHFGEGVVKVPVFFLSFWGVEKQQ